MISTLTPLIPQILSRLLVASVVGAGSYLFWRFVEKKIPTAIIIFASFSGLFVFLLIMAAIILVEDYFTSNIPSYSAIVILQFVGGFFHRKSGGASKTQSQAFLFSFVATWSSLVIGLMINKDAATIYSTNSANLIYYFSLVIYTIITPVLIWVWKSFRLRPGIDKHFDE